MSWWYFVIFCIASIMALVLWGNYKVAQWMEVTNYDFEHGTTYRFDPGYVPDLK